MRRWRRWAASYLRQTTVLLNFVSKPAIGVYVLVAIAKKELKSERSLGELLQILSLTLFEKTPLSQAFSPVEGTIPDETRPKQPSLFYI